MSKRLKKRYNTREEILEDIERYKLKARALKEQAAGLDSKADRISQSEGADLNSELISFTRIQADKCRKQAGSIEENKMQKLKQKLAEFQTQTIDGIVNDPSIPR